MLLRQVFPRPVRYVLALPGRTGRAQFHHSGLARVKYLKNGFPQNYNYTQAFKIWLDGKFSSDQDQKAQDRLLECVLPYYNKEINGVIATNEKVPIDDAGNYLNEIRVENKNSNDEPTKHLVMLHGYAASAGWWFKNIDGLIQDHSNTTLHLLDMLGFGLSSRPALKFPMDNRVPLEINYNKDELDHLKHIHKSLYVPKKFSVSRDNLEAYLKNQKEVIREVEDAYVDSIEQWRVKSGLEKFDLMGHSLGGYMALSYALKYPNSVGRLILVSPGGIERSPFAISNPQYQTPLIDEIIEFKASHWPGDYGFLSRYPMVKEAFKRTWRWRISSFTWLRLLGPLGVRLLSLRNVRKLSRSGSLDKWQEVDLFLQYMYHTNTKRSFSETAIMRIFDASIVAKYPMLDRVAGLEASESVWIYGEHDFMFNDCGRAAVRELGEAGRKASFITISNAGHNMYLDNYLEFNKRVVEFLGWQRKTS